LHCLVVFVNINYTLSGTTHLI